VHDHKIGPALLHLRFWPSKSKVHDNSKTLLKHNKCLLDILPTSLLALLHMRVHFLHICRSRRIDTIYEVVPSVVWVAIDPKFNYRSMFLGQSCKHRRSLQYINVIMSSCHAKYWGPGLPQLQVSHYNLYYDLCTTPRQVNVQFFQA
jgi:hypothetical protein